jgi:hypothetical protein
MIGVRAAARIDARPGRGLAEAARAGTVDRTPGLAGADTGAMEGEDTPPIATMGPTPNAPSCLDAQR